MNQRIPNKTILFFLTTIFLICAQDLLAQNSALQEGLNAYHEDRYRDAFRLLLPFAKQGNRIAQHRICRMYVDGEGVGKNFQKGYEFCRRSISQQYFAAMNSLAYGYRNGIGLPVDIIRAYAWETLSLLHIPDSAPYAERLRAAARNSINKYRQKMSSAQLAQAKELVDNWKPGMGDLAGQWKTEGDTSKKAARGLRPAQDSNNRDNSRKAHIRAAQFYLDELGFDTGPADGVMGAKTRAAAAAAREQLNLAGEGVGTDLIDAVRGLVIRNADALPGAHAFEAGRYADALEALAPLAKKHNRRAIRMLALIYRHGLGGVPRNADLAAKLDSLSGRN